MVTGWLHRRMPRSLVGRAALILVAPVVALLVVVATAFVQRYYEDVTRQMTRSLILELDYLADAVARAADAAEAATAAQAIGRPLGLDVALPAPAPAGDVRPAWDLAGREMARTLAEDGPEVLAVDLGVARRVTLWLDTRHGPMAVAFARGRVAASNPHQLLVIMAVMAALMSGTAYLFLRNQLRPVRRLAEAAMAYGRGRIVPFRPGGAVEVRAAGAAFLDMRNRIERQSQARTTMLAGVSHDLRTPLTRLKLGLSMIDDPEVAGLARDVDDMQRMVDAFLAFAKGDAGDEEEATEVTTLVRAVVADFARAGRAVAMGDVDGQDPGPVALRPLAVRRALENLIGNALAYGSASRVSLAFGDRTLRLTVEDDGPGIPPERRDEAMRPFARLDAARNQDRPGAGLGLAIVADIARAHGGSLRLGESAAMGGLRADLVLAR